MSDTKFTKGEWFISDSTTNKDISIWSSESNCITSINYGFWDENHQDELKANAHLIAAAPDMYKALEALSKGEGLQPGTTIESILIKARGE